jgi:hypothetical protein
MRNGAAPEVVERRSSLATLGGHALDVHDHLCVLYQGRIDWEDLLLPFLREGVTSGHPCLVVVAQPGGCRVVSTLTDDRVGNELVPRLDFDHGAVPSGAYVSSPISQVLHSWSTSVFDDLGWSAARAILCLGDAPTRDVDADETHPTDTARAVSAWAESRRQIALSFYDLADGAAEVVLSAIKTHHKVWMGGTMIENPYA